MEHPEYGEVIQLQGDQRGLIKDFLKKTGLAKEEQLKVGSSLNAVSVIEINFFAGSKYLLRAPDKRRYGR